MALKRAILCGSEERHPYQFAPEQQVSFTGHIPQVQVQVAVLQINKQAQKCLLALISIQNFVVDRGETVWLIYEIDKTVTCTCDLWNVTCKRNLPAHPPSYPTSSKILARGLLKKVRVVPIFSLTPCY